MNNIPSYHLPYVLPTQCFGQNKKKNHSDQIRLHLFQPHQADQMPGPPREGQLMCTLFLSMHAYASYTKQHQRCHPAINHGNPLRSKLVLIPITQILQCQDLRTRALEHSEVDL